MSKVSDLTSSVLEDALKSLTKVDASVANTSIISAQRIEKDAERVMDKPFDFRLSQKTVVAVRLDLESLKRISEYGEDMRK